MKKLLSISIAVFLMSISAFALTETIVNITAELRPDYVIYIDGEKQEFKNEQGDTVYPISYEDTTYLPVRAISEAFGKDVYWNEESKKIDLIPAGEDLADYEVKMLTSEQVDEVNEAFAYLLPRESDDQPLTVVNPDGSEEYLNPICHFFSSYYNDPTEMDMRAFMYYVSRESFLDIEKDVEEIADLKELGLTVPIDDLGFIVPFGRISYETVDEMLLKYANVSLDDMKNMNNVPKADKYGCFYSSASDFGPGYFECIGGEIDGDTVTLFSDNAVLTLQKDGENYYIVSHLEK